MAKIFTFLLTALISFVSTIAPAQQRREKPNIILINVDDLGWSDLVCYGSKYYETPNIDKLASEGILFTNAYASASVCSPTRAAIMTGKAPARTGITDWIRARFQGGAIPEDKQYHLKYEGNASHKLLTPSNPLWMELEEVTIAELLKQNGYTTCHIGKWHLGADDWYPEEQGFDYNIGGCDYGQPPSYFDPYYNNEKMPDIPGLPPRKKGEYLEDRLADEAMNFITTHQDKPFFLNMWNYAVHTPIQGRSDLVTKYEKKKRTNQKSADYAAMVESVDETVGKIMQTLKKLKLDQQTLVIFTSDNGGLEMNNATDNDPLRSGKGYAYEGGIRVPMIVRWQGKIKKNQRNDTPVISHDLFPTFCEAAGITARDKRDMDGLSLLPILTENRTLDRTTLYWHFPHYRMSDIVPYSIIREGDWKLIKRYEGKEFELFHLGDDLSEEKDLSEKMPEKVVELNKKLMHWLDEAGARLPGENPKYTPIKK
ncbi:MAG: sulfatase [Cyclobacteriaceae bacterium]